MEFEEFKREIKNVYEKEAADKIKNSHKRFLSPAQTWYLKGYVRALEFVIREMEKVGKKE